MTPSQKIWHEHHFLFTDALWGLLFSALTIIASRPHTLVNRLLSSRVFTSLGTISYSVYLLHLPLLVASGVLVKQHHLSNEVTIFLELLVVIPVILGISYGFHVLFERPFMHAPRPRHQPAILSSAAPKVLADR
jgi:peptidoglycan/LPS O-acetylase OafA/YrhL